MKQKDDVSAVSSNEGQEALLKALRFCYNSLKLTVIILLFCYAVSGVFVVRPYENVFIVRFGEIIGDTRSQQIIESGQWHWAWPKPVETVIRVPVKQTIIVSTNHFWYDRDPFLKTSSQPAAGTKDTALVPGIDGYLLTGDRNLLHAQWSLTYQILDPVSYSSRYHQPRDMIQKILEQVVLSETAQISIDDALYGNADDLRSRIQLKVHTALDRANLGVTIKNVTYDAKEPPRAALASFNRVAEAVQEKSQEINAARGYANKLIHGRKGKSAEIITRAQADRSRAVASIKADEQYFMKIMDAYDTAPDTTLMNLYTRTLNDALDRVETKYIIHAGTDDSSREIRLLLGPENTPLKLRDQ